jgi:transposase-like protein
MSVRALKRLSKEQAYEAFKANPDFIKNRSRAARAWGVERGTIRNWEREWQRKELATPPPLASQSPPVAPPPVAPTQPEAMPATNASVPVESLPTATATRLAVPPATVRRKGLVYLTQGVAVGLAGIAAFFSLSGMVVIFPGTPTAILIMGGMMEAAKVVGTAFVSSHWGVLGYIPRFVLVTLIAGLAAINAVGVSSQLMVSHLGDRVTATSSFEIKQTAVKGMIQVKTQSWCFAAIRSVSH